MKVLIISKTLPQNFKGGIQTHVWELSDRLVKAGLEVTILTGGTFRKGLTKRKVGGRAIIALPYIPWRRSPWFRECLEELAFNLAVARWVKQNYKRYDIIHIQGRSGYLVPFLNVDRPIVNTVHRLWAVEGKWATKDFKSTFEAQVFGWMTRYLESKSLQRSNAIIGISQSTIEEILQYSCISKEKIHLIYNGASEKTNQSDAPAIKQQLLFVGRLCAIKGVFPLLEAIKHMSAKIRLVMVGDGPARPELESFIEKHQLQGTVELIGSQEQAVVRQLMRESFALILPSFHESQGIVLMESNLEERPVLATAAAGIKEVVIPNQNGLLFQAGSVKAMVEAIQELFSDPTRAAQMGKRGKEFVRQYFNWEQIAQQTIQTYAGL